MRGQQDARLAIGNGDYAQKEMMDVAEGRERRYRLAYNRTILLEQPFIKPANLLEGTMVALANKPSKETERAFEDALLTSPVYLCTTKAGYEAMRAGATDVTFLMMPIGGDANAMVIFSSSDRLRQAFHNDRQWYWVKVTGAKAMALSRGRTIVLNYALRPPVTITAEQAERLAQRAAVDHKAPLAEQVVG